ncbi:MAG TPA: FtsX-like permease family protein [Parafilimonas sp.]|nr:FtsX-like permease family protein [Parafilimonas sp.]
MLKNYLKTAWRNIIRNKFFSLINIIGLAIGISASLVIYLIVSYDLSFDKFEKNGDRIYRVVSDMKFPDNDFKNSGLPMPLNQAIQKDLTGIEMFVPLSTPNGDINVSIASATGNTPDKYKKQKDIVYVDNNYFNMLSYTWLAGSPQNSLHDPFTTVLTESRAKAYFPGNDLSKDIGKIITYNDSIKTTVTGIVKDIDKNTDFSFKEFISYSTIPNSGLKNNTGWDEWGSVNSANQLFIKLNEATNTGVLTKQIQQLFDKHQKEAYLKSVFSLQPLSDVHFNSDYDSFNERIANRTTLYSLLAVAAILLVLACINFINLTTAQAAQRAKEIGVRKTMGSSKRQLIFQFLSETFLLTFFATIISLILTPFIIKLFHDFIPPKINAGMLVNANVVIFVVALILVITFFAGFYPSIILSKYNPVLVLKGNTSSGSTRRVWIRKSLTVTQFVFAQAFIIAAIIVSTQIRYTLNKDLGFRKDGIITVETPIDYFHLQNLPKQASVRDVLLQKIKSLPGVSLACTASEAPATNGSSFGTMKFNTGKKQIETTVQIKNADDDYFKLYKMHLLAGRFPRRSDSAIEYMINETYAKFLGFKNPADAVGKVIDRGDKQTPIVGVLKDFYSQSLHAEIKPLAYYSDKNWQSQLEIALKPETTAGAWQTTIGQIKKAYKEIYPDEDFTYNFVDETIAKFYDSEKHTSTLLSWATALAIIISCLGLLGLVIYTTNQRTKEIGVRKVLGATVAQIVTLLSKDFIKLVLFAFVIAAPIAWLGMNKWMQNFAYRANISWWIFLASGISIILIALLTLSIQIIRAAIANPVKSLRTE